MTAPILQRKRRYEATESVEDSKRERAVDSCKYRAENKFSENLKDRIEALSTIIQASLPSPDAPIRSLIEIYEEHLRVYNEHLKVGSDKIVVYGEKIEADGDDEQYMSVLLGKQPEFSKALEAAKGIKDGLKKAEAIFCSIIGFSKSSVVSERIEFASQVRIITLETHIPFCLYYNQLVHSSRNEIDKRFIENMVRSLKFYQGTPESHIGYKKIALFLATSELTNLAEIALKEITDLRRQAEVRLDIVYQLVEQWDCGETPDVKPLEAALPILNGMNTTPEGLSEYKSYGMIEVASRFTSLEKKVHIERAVGLYCSIEDNPDELDLEAGFDLLMEILIGQINCCDAISSIEKLELFDKLQGHFSENTDFQETISAAKALYEPDLHTKENDLDLLTSDIGAFYF